MVLPSTIFQIIETTFLYKLDFIFSLHNTFLSPGTTFLGDTICGMFGCGWSCNPWEVAWSKTHFLASYWWNWWCHLSGLLLDKSRQLVSQHLAFVRPHTLLLGKSGCWRLILEFVWWSEADNKDTRLPSSFCTQGCLQASGPKAAIKYPDSRLPSSF